MKKRRFIIILCIVALFICSFNVSAATELENKDGSYVFNNWGDTQTTPKPYQTQSTLSIKQFAGSSAMLTDLAVDSKGRYFIADSAGSCIWSVDKELTSATKIDGYSYNGDYIKFSACEGVWAADEKLYIANTAGKNIVVLDENSLETLAVVNAPTESEWSSTVDFEPIRLSTDGGGRIYVISRNQTQGIVQFTKEGKFIGFLGALEVNPSAWDIFIRTIGTEEMKKRTLQLVPTEFSNLICNQDGLVMSITETVTDSEIYSGKKVPVRLLNPLGNDIHKNNGYFSTIGDVDFTLWVDENSGASRFIDVAVSENGIYSLLDRVRGKVFTYDSDGNLLYVFGSLGSGVDCFEQPVSMVYSGNDIAVLDQSSSKLILLSPTDFSKMILTAYNAHENGNAEEETACWEAIDKEFSGYYLTDIGLGKALYNKGEYKAAMEKFRAVNNKTYYSKAYKGLQTQFVEKNLGWLILCVAAGILLLAMAVKLLKKVLQHNNSVVSCTLKSGWDVITHPFNGFWNLKWEKQGTVSGATIILGASIIVNYICSRFTPYISSTVNLKQTNLLISILSVVAVLLLFVVANWCLTTLFDGKGTIRDIYIYSCYSLTPYVMFSIPILLIGQLLTQETIMLYTSLNLILIVYCLFLLITGTLTVHQFSLGKTILMLIISVIAVMLMVFLIVLCVSLIGNIADCISGVVREITLRYS